MENFSTILQTVWRPAQINSWGVASTPLTGRGLNVIALRIDSLLETDPYTVCVLSRCP